MPTNTNDIDPATAPSPRPFSLEMIHADLMVIRESLSQIVNGGERWCSTRATVALEKADHLITRIAVERAVGKAAL